MKKYILKHKTSAFLYMLIGTMTSLNGIAMTYAIQYIVEIVTNNQTDNISNMFWIIIVYCAGMALVFTLYGIARNKFCVNVMQEIRQDLFRSLIKKNVVDFSKENTGYYTSLFQNDLKIVESTLMASFLLLLQLQEIVFSLVYAFVQNIVIGIVLILVGIAGVIIPTMAQKILQKNQEKLMNEAAMHNSFINDSLHGYEVIKNYQVEENILKKYAVRNQAYGRNVYQTMAFQHCTNYITRVFLLSLQMLLIAISGIMVLRNELSISFVTVIVGLSSSVINAMCSAVEAIVDRKSGQGVCKKIFEEIESDCETMVEENISFEDSFTLKDISFSYPNKEETVLENINISFQKGNKYLLVGESGTGKSTFIKLLLQYYADYQGSMFMDGRNIRDISAKSVMEQFAVIPQNVVVFEDTLRNNITLYHPFSDECVMEAAKKAGLEDLINKLENGMDYVIREGGNNLSGGERQRIAIARAFLHNRKIWIMDEATSNLDKDMAEQIERTVLEIPDITVIMIAHYYDERTIERCDEVYKIEKKGLHKV